MNRREALSIVAAVPLAAGATAPLAEAPSLFPVFVKVGDEWRRVRMFELVVGNVFRIEDGHNDARVFCVHTPPALITHPDGLREWEVFGQPLSEPA